MIIIPHSDDLYKTLNLIKLINFNLLMEKSETQTLFLMKSNQNKIEEINFNRGHKIFKVIYSKSGVNQVESENENFLTKNKILRGRRNSINKKLKNSWKSKIFKKGENFNVGRWSIEEHQKFMEALLKYGNNWKKVQDHIITRNSTQARSHAQKFFVKIGKTQIQTLDLDFKNKSLSSLSLLMNKLEIEQIASSLRSFNEIVLHNKKEINNYNEVNNYSSTESDSINLKIKNKKDTKISKLKEIIFSNEICYSEKNSCIFEDRKEILNCNSLLETKSYFTKNQELPESPKIFSEFYSYSNSNSIFSSRKENYNNPSIHRFLLNEFGDDSDSLKFYLDKENLTKKEIESKPIQDENYFKLFFDENNLFKSEQEGLNFEIEHYYDELKILSDIEQSMREKETFSLHDNQSLIKKVFFSIFSLFCKNNNVE